MSFPLFVMFFYPLLILLQFQPLSSAAPYSVVKVPNEIFGSKTFPLMIIPLKTTFVTEIGKRGSSPSRARHIDLNNNKILSSSSNKQPVPVAKTDFHVSSPYVVRTLIKDDGLVYNPIINSFVPRKEPKPKQKKYYNGKTLSSHQVEQKRHHYRDDKTHEPNFYADDFLRNEQNKKGIILKSIHETPINVPVKPVYPGEGQWAVRGRKHKPYERKHLLYSKLEDKTEHPEAEEIFEAAKIVFKEQQTKFPFRETSKLKLPSDSNNYNKNNNIKNKNNFKFVTEPIRKTSKKNKKRKENDDQVENNGFIENGEEEEEEFVPTRTLAQVRKYEKEEHNLPPIEPRLREVIKDTKTHTIFTEEGYEDLGYDHANHEKNAEKDEESEELDESLKIVKIKPKDNIAINDSQEQQPTNHQDILSVSSSNVVESIPNTTLTNSTAEEMINNNYNATTPPETSTSTERIKEYGFRVKRSINEDNTPSESHLMRRIPFKLILKTIRMTNIRPFQMRRQKRSTNYNVKKYPYYNQVNLNSNSPLRYAENLKNVPKKEAGKMSFYQQAQKKEECEEIEQVDPVPKRITDKVEGKNDSITEDDQQNVGPRINKLGDKIECFKQQLFGESPLDNPLFAEKNILQPLPIFEEAEILKLASSLRSKREANVSSELDVQPEQQAFRARRKKINKTRANKPITRKHPSLRIIPSYPIESPTTALPKYKIVSEVQYKDDINPNEQLNVFTDVINNIQISSGIFNRNLNVEKSPSEKLKITTFTLPKKNKQNINFQMVTEGEGEEEEAKDTEISESNGINVYENVKQEPQSNFNRLVEDGFIVDKYYNPEEATKEPFIKYSNNNYYVLGLKPPPPLTSKHNNYRRSKIPVSVRRRNYNSYHRIGKRSAQRPAYLQIRRNNIVVEATTTESDDYVPKRNRNYYYDENLKKIVYLVTTERNRIEEEEKPETIRNNEYSSPAKRTTTTESPVSSVATIIANQVEEIESQPSFLEFVSKLKSHESYVFIPDPKLVKDKMEESETATTTTTTTENQPKSTTEAEFLKILRKVKSDPSYKEIGKKNNVTERTTKTEKDEEITTQDEEKEEEEIFETQNEPVKNAPGSKTIPGDVGTLKIFDINEYIPKPKNYTFISFVNTSKYNAIKRNPASARRVVENNDEINNTKNSTREKSPTAQVEEEKYTKKEEKVEEEVENSKATATKGKQNEEIETRNQRQDVKRKDKEEQPRRGNQRVRYRTRNEKIHRDKERRIRNGENRNKEEPRRNIRRFRVRLVSSTTESDVQKNTEKEIKRKRRDIEETVYDEDDDDESLDLVQTTSTSTTTTTTTAPETTTPTIRSRGRTRHRTAFRTTPTPRYRRGRRTKSPTATPSLYSGFSTNIHVAPLTTPHSIGSRRRRPVSRIANTTPAPLPSTNTSYQDINTESTSAISTLIDSPATTSPISDQQINFENGDNLINNHVSARKVQDVEVFKEYDKSQRHGGNYKGIDDVEVEEGEKAKQSSVRKGVSTERPFNSYNTYFIDEERFPERDEKRNNVEQRHISNEHVKGYEQAEVNVNNLNDQQQQNREKKIKEEEEEERPSGTRDEEETNSMLNHPREEEYLKERSDERRIGPAMEVEPEGIVTTETETSTTPSADFLALSSTFSTASTFYSPTPEPTDFDDVNDKLVVKVFDLPTTQDIITTTEETSPINKFVESSTIETVTTSYLNTDNPNEHFNIKSNRKHLVDAKIAVTQYPDTSPGYIVNSSNGTNFTPRDSTAPLEPKKDNNNSTRNKSINDFPQPPPVMHRMLRKRIRVRQHPGYASLPTTTAYYDDLRKTEAPKLKDRPHFSDLLENPSTTTSSVPYTNAEPSTIDNSNYQYKIKDEELITNNNQQENDKTKFYKQWTILTTTSTEAVPPLYYDTSTKDDTVETHYQDPERYYNNKRVEEERQRTPVVDYNNNNNNNNYDNQRPTSRFKSLPQRHYKITSSTEKFFFIKDPSKRNYFYAPI